LWKLMEMRWTAALVHYHFVLYWAAALRRTTKREAEKHGGLKQSIINQNPVYDLQH
jgi:hypothetical protein